MIRHWSCRNLYTVGSNPTVPTPFCSNWEGGQNRTQVWRIERTGELLEMCQRSASIKEFRPQNPQIGLKPSRSLASSKGRDAVDAIIAWNELQSVLPDCNDGVGDHLLRIVEELLQRRVQKDCELVPERSDKAVLLF